MKKLQILPLLILFLIPLMVHGQSYKKEIKNHRKSYKSNFLQNERAPLNKRDLKRMDFFKASEGYKVTAKFELTPEAKPFKMATYSGITRDYICYGIATFMLNGASLSLKVYKNLMLAKNPLYKNHLFIPFKDLSNDEESYGGGRYMDITTEEIQNGEIVLDFNKAYNPWCAYSDGYNCPVPPRDNHLEVYLKAGEKKYRGQKKTYPRQEI